jgi:glycosyltransferase involved in cell wall biosynthesis
MKVLHIINSMGSGGAEKLLSDYLIHSKENENINFLYLLSGDNNRFQTIIEKHGISTEISSRKNLYSPMHLWDLIQLLKHSSPNIVHVHLFPGIYYIAIISYIFPKIKFFMTEHNTSNRRRLIPLLKPLERILYNRYHSVVCVSDAVKDNLVLWLNKFSNVRTIYNSIDLDLYRFSDKSNIRDQLKLTENDILIIMVASLTAQKNHELLIESMGLLDDRFKLLLVGEGIKFGKLNELVRDTGLEDRVIFLGFRSDVASLYKACDIAVLSSHYEGFGLSAIEALATRIPLVITNTPGLSDVVGEFATKLTNNDIYSMKKAIINTLINNTQNDPKDLDIFLSQYSINTFKKSIQTLYDLTLKENN